MVQTLRISPYMLRYSDGALLNCGRVHPYIKYVKENNTENELMSLFTNDLRRDWLQWFYDNTANKETKDAIVEFISAVVGNEYYRVLLEDAGVLSGVINKWQRKLYELELSRDDVEDLYEQLNVACNNEFLKVRCGNIRFGGTNAGDVYFRIGSVGLDWADTIFKFCVTYRGQVQRVTITNDNQSFGGGTKYYYHKGEVIDRMPVDEFLSLSGRPVFERYTIPNKIDLLIQEAKGNLLAVFKESHPARVIDYYDTSAYIFNRDHFTEHST